MNRKKVFIIILLVTVFISCTNLSKINKTSEVISGDSLQIILTENDLNQKHNTLNLKEFNIPKGTKINLIIIDNLSKNVKINTNRNLSFKYIREDNLKEIYEWAKNYIPPQYKNYKIEIYTQDELIENLIPNIYRKKTEIDKLRLSKNNIIERIPVVSNLSKPYLAEKGLKNRNIALWNSHGWYYNHKFDRWMWQRARLFQIVEDLATTAFTTPYLIPMLENAGANVFIPRERDIQLNEVVIDNEDLTDSFLLVNNITNQWKLSNEKGFANNKLPFKAKDNPFNMGNHHIIKSEPVETAFANYLPNIPENGEYAVYVSYVASENNAKDAKYTVYHTGGKTVYKVNQQIGGNTWIYLGTFSFKKGKNPLDGKIVLSNISKEKDKIISADAVKFGGGMGIVERNGKTSNKPKFAEGARYWLQYAGMPDSLVYSFNNEIDDYKDDYQSRGEWVNYLIGKPFGPSKNRNIKGLGIPIDLSLAFHTDAGITNTDSTIGTLVIYSNKNNFEEKVFPDSVSRLLNRDLADIVQTEIVNDIKAKYDPIWNRRQLMDAMYSESARPNVPTVLLELLSHQNFLDNKFQLDPRYRFDVSRSIYKAMLKFLAFQHNYDYVVQPLPVSHFAATIKDNNKIKLSWKATEDTLEPTAKAHSFILYKKIGDSGFDNGILVNENYIELDKIKKNKIYSFKVTAVNDGGESFPSEILSVGISENNKDPILIVNGFDRISAPASVDYENYSGFLNNVDAGVPDKYDLTFTGVQHTYERNIKWTTDDMPGHGASYADYEAKIIAGNNFNYPFTYGETLLKNNISFVSVSDEAIYDRHINMNDYKIVFMIMGEEKETDWPKEFSDNLLGKQFKVFPEKLQKVLTEYFENSGNLFISGSYIGTDLFMNKADSHSDVNFGKEIMKYKLAAERAVKSDQVYSTKNDIFDRNLSFNFNTELNDNIYAVEAPNAIDPINGSQTILRYVENDFSAAIAFKNNYSIVAFGFPFETITDSKIREDIIKNIIKYFNEK